MDQQVYQFLHSFQSERLTEIMKFITFFGSTIFIIGLCFVVFIVNQKVGLWLGIHVAVIAFINQIVKFMVARPRPAVIHLVIENGYSFPSAHAMVSLILFGLLAYILWQQGKHVAIVLTVIPLLIGITRIYLGVHYTSDVIAGLLFSIVYLSTVNFLSNYHKRLPIS